MMTGMHIGADGPIHSSIGVVEIPSHDSTGIKANSKSNSISNKDSHEKRLERIIQYLNGCNKPGKCKRYNIQSGAKTDETDASGKIHDKSNELDPLDRMVLRLTLLSTWIQRSILVQQNRV
jgi:hypothetical protein